jgi:hypothetical protein
MTERLIELTDGGVDIGEAREILGRGAGRRGLGLTARDPNGRRLDLWRN